MPEMLFCRPVKVGHGCIPCQRKQQALYCLPRHHLPSAADSRLNLRHSAADIAWEPRRVGLALAYLRTQCDCGPYYFAWLGGHALACDIDETYK
jgi:hypothetical protein